MADFTVIFQKFLDQVADTRWPWRRQRRQIKHLSASELMRHATSLLSFAGRSHAAGRLVYQAILKDTYQVDALLCMSDFLGAGDAAHFSIDLNPYASVVLEHGLGPKSRVTPEGKQRIRLARLKLMVRLDFAKHRSGKKIFDERDYLDPSKFDLDEPAYFSSLMSPVQELGTIADTFKLAHAFLGVYAALVAYRPHEKVGAHSKLSSFVLSPTYYDWLRSDPEALVRGYLDRKKMV